MNIRNRLLAPGLLLVLVVSVGCNSGTNPNAAATVHGQVTYNGSPVTGGFVYLHFEDGGRMAAAIGPDGSYSADTKEGTYAVTVETESLNPAKKQEYRGQGGGGAKGQYKGAGAGAGVPKGKGAQASPIPEGATAGTYVKIPAKYADKSTSGLTVTLKHGKTKFDIPLTD